jgi:UDP-glucose 4-epimerase
MTDKVLVTGAAGFVGQHLVQRLADEGHEVVAVDIKQQAPESYRDRVGSGVEYISGSIVHREFVENEVVPAPDVYDRVFHLAAVVGVDRYIGGEDTLYAMDVNINGTRYLLSELRTGTTRFVYTSTSEVYGKNPSLPWPESADQVLGPPTSPRWSYSTSKTVSEHMVHALGRENTAFSTSVVRPFNLYGPHQREQFVISKFMQQVADGEVPTVYGDGTQRRCFTYIEDFVEGIVAASERDHDGTEVYNLGGTEEIEIRSLATEIMSLGGMSDRDPEFVSRDEVYDDDFEDPDRRIPDITSAQEKLDWEPTTPLRAGLETTYEWMQSTRS